MTTMTPEDAIRAASSVARDVADGKLSPIELERQALAELRELVGTVIGPDDPVWPLQRDIARQVLALGGIPASELAEWLAVERQPAGEPVSSPEPAETPPEPESFGSEALSAASAAPELEPVELAAPPEPEQPEPTAIPPARRGEYDPLAGWPGSRSLRG